jgi:hypothetical protein
MWTCVLVSTHTDTKPSHILPSSQTPVSCNLTRESSRVRLMSNKMSTGTPYTPPILHTLHTLHSDTLVLTSLHTCQGQEHSRSRRRVETSAVRSTPTHKTTHQSHQSVQDSLLQLLKTNCVISSVNGFQVRFWCRFCMWTCVLVSTHTDTKPSHILPSSQTPVSCNLTRESSRVSLLSNKMFTRSLCTPPILHILHSDTLVLTSLHTCQGQEHSLPRRRVETSSVRSTPPHKTTHQSQYSVQDSILQLLKTNCVISSVDGFQVRFWCRFCMWTGVHTHTHKTVTHSTFMTNTCKL